jgi:hypothetical protein
MTKTQRGGRRLPEKLEELVLDADQAAGDRSSFTPG